jgi:hypothetical protein
VAIEAVDPTTGDFASRKRRRDQAFGELGRYLGELGRYLGELADAHRDHHPGDGMLSSWSPTTARRARSRGKN